MMKTISKLLFIALLGLITSFKVYSQAVDMVIDAVQLSPAPATYPGTVNFGFQFYAELGSHQLSSDDLAGNYAVIVVSDSKLDGTGITPTGSGADLFTWTYDPATKSFTGKSKDVVVEEDVIYNINFTGVPTTTASTANDIGFSANLTPPGDLLNSDPTDDSVARFTSGTAAATPPVASNDNGSTTGTPVILTVLTNDTPGSAPIDPTKVMLIDPNTNTPSTNVNIPGEGTYVVNTTTGEVTFTPDPAVTTPITSTIQYTITDNNNLTSVPATISINVTPLPVTLVSFTAKKEGAVALLNWATTEETNSDRFEIQHSVSGKDWVNVGEVASSGESKVLKNYTFSHTKPVHGQNLYRLKMIDKDMTFAYSRIQGVSFEGIAAADLSVYPNPSTDKLFIRDNGTVKEVVINNLNGNAVYRASSSFAAGDGLIDVTTLPQGMYIVKVTRQNGLVSTSKVVINK